MGQSMSWRSALRAVSLLLVIACSTAAAAPDEAAYGAPDYPVPSPSEAFRQRFLVAAHSRADSIFPAHLVARGESVWPLVPARHPPPIAYRLGAADLTVEDILARHPYTGVLILKGDRIVFERYQYERSAEDRMLSHSMAKTVTSMLIGIALAEGKIRSLDDKAQAYVPALAGRAYGETSLRQLLRMSSGVRFVEEYDGKDDSMRLVRATYLGEGEGGAAAVLPFNEREHPPGTHFHYASAETFVLALALRAAIGEPIADYASSRLWQKLGAEADASWLVDRSGLEPGYCCFNARLRDWGRLGLLLASDGSRDGVEVVPKAYLREATSVSSDAPYLAPGREPGGYGYGYQTWIMPGPDRNFALLGVRGQSVFVDPAHKIVMAMTAVFTQSRVGAAVNRERAALWRGVKVALANWQDE
jgi:CubicO group peptidase (beta-lactamase class C family)